MTFVSYPNISVESANERYRLQIEGTPRKQYFRDQADFVYRLYQSNQLRWEWPAAAVENGVEFLDDYPHEAWVSDEGWSVIRTHEWFQAGLIVCSPTGQVVLRRLFRQHDKNGPPGFLDGVPDKYIRETSAGPFWSRSGIAYFANHKTDPLWVMRTWWGHRVIIDLQRADFLDPSSVNQDLLLAIETTMVSGTLASGVKQLEGNSATASAAPEGERDWSTIDAVRSAAYHAGWLQVESAIPSLRRMEDLGPVCESQSYDFDLAANCFILPLRQLAKLSLLRLGQPPKGRPHYCFEPRDAERNESDAAAMIARWAKQGPSLNFTRLELGLSASETLRHLGPPDFIDRQHWDYDVFTSSGGETIRIIWEAPADSKEQSTSNEQTEDESTRRIATIQYIEPQWTQITIRDRFVI